MKSNEKCDGCGMHCHPGEYHPYAACLMFQACKDDTIVRRNLWAVMSHGITRQNTLRPAQYGKSMTSAFTLYEHIRNLEHETKILLCLPDKQIEITAKPHMKKEVKP